MQMLSMFLSGSETTSHYIYVKFMRTIINAVTFKLYVFNIFNMCIYSHLIVYHLFQQNQVSSPW